MTPHVLTLAPRDALTDAARLMRQERIGAIPVVDGARLVGIVTRADVLNAFVNAAPPRPPVTQAECW
jgi:CBS domain-containing protein